jgi:hypothetical protein
MFAASKSGKAAAGVSPTTDPSFAYVPLLLETTGTSGQQNNTFLDSSTNNFTITRNGTPTQGSITPYWPNGQWSNYFNGSSDYLTAPASSALTLTADFTIEFWVYSGAFASGASNPSLFNTSTASIFYESSGSNRGLCLFVGSAIITTATTVLPNNQWNHVVCVRSGSIVSMFVNGSRVGTNASFSSTADFSSAFINRYFASAAGYLNGYMSNLRVVKGTAVYDPTLTTLTVPTTPLTAISGTSLLTCQSNRFKDNSSNAFAITVNGTPTVQAFQPFSPAASYSAATYAGSGYFNGSTDYLTAPSNAVFGFSTGQFTIEFFVYFTSLTNVGEFFRCSTNTTNGAFCLYYASNILQAVPIGGGTATNATPNFVVNTWYHIACSRDSSNNQRIFINGVQAGTATSTVNYSQNGFSFGAGLNGVYFNGYVSNIRVVKGTAVYTSAFTPPTTPVTAITNTSLLLNFTNAGIYDAAAQNNITTVGTAQVATTPTPKWPPSSIYLNGSANYLTIPAGPQWLMSGDWTFEAWIYPTTVTGVQIIINTKNISAVTSPVMYLNGSNLVIDTGVAAVVSAGTIIINSWQYVAATRSGNAWKLFINGSQVGSTTTNTTSYSTAYGCAIGRSSFGENFNGYIQDVRVTNGVARTITTPTAAFPTR